MEACPQCSRPYGVRRRCYYCQPSPVPPGRPRRGEILKCASCGVDFYATAKEQSTGPRKFCSWRCHGLGMTAEYNATWQDRFWSRVAKGDGCWEWQGRRYVPSGYGLASIRGRSTGAHRVSWEIHNGPIPSGMVVRHDCDNKPCVRPDHLRLGTPGENSADLVARGTKGRHLREPRIRTIRALHAGGFDAEEIGRVLRLKPSSVEALLRA